MRETIRYACTFNAKLDGVGQPIVGCQQVQYALHGKKEHTVDLGYYLS